MLNASSAPCANFEMMQMLSAAKSSAEREKLASKKRVRKWRGSPL